MVFQYILLEEDVEYVYIIGKHKSPFKEYTITSRQDIIYYRTITE